MGGGEETGGGGGGGGRGRGRQRDLCQQRGKKAEMEAQKKTFMIITLNGNGQGTDV